MRVLFISGADQMYGTFKMSQKLLDQANRGKGIEYIVVTQKHGPLNEWCDTNHIENYVCPYKYCVYHPIDKWVLNKLKHIIKYMIVTCSNLVAFYKLKKTGIINRVDLIHTNINRDLFGMFISRKTSIPNVTYLREFSKAHFGLKPIYRNQVTIMNKYSSRFIAISESVKKDWHEFGLDADKIEVVYEGVDTSEYSLCKKGYAADDYLRIVMCGAIYEGKGQKEILAVVSELILDGFHIHLDFYGGVVNDSYYIEMKKMIESNNLQENIRFLGYQDKMSSILGKYDVGVICSKAEGFGLVTIEYMLSGLTVVASNTGANPELLKDGKYGFLYSLGNLEQLRKIIVEIYNNRDKSNASAKCAIQYAMDEYNISNTIKRLIHIYSSVLGHDQRRCK